MKNRPTLSWKKEAAFSIENYCSVDIILEIRGNVKSRNGYFQHQTRCGYVIADGMQFLKRSSFLHNKSGQLCYTIVSADFSSERRGRAMTLTNALSKNGFGR